MLVRLFMFMFLLLSIEVSGQTNERFFRIVAVSQADTNLWSASNKVRAVAPLKMEIPTAFSPNDDGLNDTFGVLAKGLEYFELTVYNRWEKLFFYSDQIGARWDGEYK